MSIYDKKFYGIYSFHDGDALNAKLWETSEEIEFPADSSETRQLEISLLEEYKGKKDVLAIWLKEEETFEYMTLLYPWQIYDEGWHKINNNVIQLEFLKLYIKVTQNMAKTYRASDLYDLKFFGVYYQYKMEFSGVCISHKKEEVHAIPGFENSFFEVTVLKKYKGKKDVLKLEFKNGDVAYETLYYPYLYVDAEDNIWRKSNDISTPEVFMKAYLRLKA